MNSFDSAERKQRARATAQEAYEDAGIMGLCEEGRMEVAMSAIQADRRQIALLRGINVGSANRVAMADLRKLVAELGYGKVKTLLNTGNIVFEGNGESPAEAAARIQAALAEKLGVSSRTLGLSMADLDAVAAENTLAARADPPSRLQIAFLADPSHRALLEPLLEKEWGEEALAVGSRAAYLWCPAGVIASRLPEEIGKRLGDAVTTRNWSTVTKLYELASKHPD